MDGWMDGWVLAVVRDGRRLFAGAKQASELMFEFALKRQVFRCMND
jgi:hypothetical protein